MKLSVSLPDDECLFLDQCVSDGLYPSRSAVLLRALRLLKSADLGKMYAEAFDEWNESAEGKEWDAIDAARDTPRA
jgi:Arc/MetJ-type ribon-helix-helix transcriptional regulator